MISRYVPLVVLAGSILPPSLLLVSSYCTTTTTITATTPPSLALYYFHCSHSLSLVQLFSPHLLTSSRSVCTHAVANSRIAVTFGRGSHPVHPYPSTSRLDWASSRRIIPYRMASRVQQDSFIDDAESWYSPASARSSTRSTLLVWPELLTWRFTALFASKSSIYRIVTLDRVRVVIRSATLVHWLLTLDISPALDIMCGTT